MTSVSGSGDDTEDGGVTDSLRADLRRCRSARLHLLAPGVLTATLALAAVAFVVVSAAVGAPADFVSFVEILTTNAAWLFASVFALVGLFVAYPSTDEDGSRATVVGTLVSRWLLVAVGVVLGFFVVLVVALVAFEAFGVAAFVAATLLTTATVCAYVSVGVSLAFLTGSEERHVLSLLTFYGFFVFLWDTGLVPTAVAIAVVGDPVEVVGSPPALYDALLAVSPSGAYSVLTNSTVGVGDATGGAVVVAAFALVFWLVFPPALAAVAADGDV